VEALGNSNSTFNAKQLSDDTKKRAPLTTLLPRHIPPDPLHNSALYTLFALITASPWCGIETLQRVPYFIVQLRI